MKAKPKADKPTNHSHESTSEEDSAEPATSAAPQRKAAVKRRPAKARATGAVPWGTARHDKETGDGDLPHLEQDIVIPDGIDQTKRTVPTTRPKTSGVFDYLRWVLSDALTPEELDLVKAKAAKQTLSVGSMCAGMGTEEIVLRGLDRALQEHHTRLRYRSAFKAEKDPENMKFLQSHYADSGATFVWDNKDLHQRVFKDANGEVVDGQVPVDVLLCGIVCKDISPLNTKPKTERAKDGKSGSSLDGLLSYLKCLSLETRPKVIILECVQRLGHKRQVDPDDRQGTVYIQDELTALGYSGGWRNVNSKDFFLPQSRPRVYGLFLRLHSQGLGVQGRGRRDADAATALSLVDRLKVPGPPEPLSTVLQRCRAVGAASDKPKKRRRAEPEESHRGPASWDLPREDLEGGPVWRRDHREFVDNTGLSKEDLQGYQAFEDAAKGALQPRAMEGLFLKLACVRKDEGVDWTQPDRITVASVGASLRFMSVRQDIFPCVTPKMVYAVIEHGQLRTAGGLEALALQGVQGQEVHSFKLGATKGPFLQELAGNAYTANIVAAFLLAGLLAT